MDNNTEYEETMLFFLNDTLEKIESGDKTTANYYYVFQHYESAQKKNEYKNEVEKYAKLTLDSAINNIDNFNTLPDYAKEDIINKKSIAQEYCYLSRIYDYYKNNKQKLYCINKAIELEPENGYFYLLRARYYSEKYDFKNSELDYKKVIELGNKEWTSDAELMISCNKSQIYAKYVLIFIIFLIILEIFAPIFANILVICFVIITLINRLRG